MAGHRAHCAATQLMLSQTTVRTNGKSCHLLFPGKHTASEHKLKPLLLELNNERSHVREVNQLLAFRRRQRCGGGGADHAAVLLHDPSTQDLALVQIAREEEIYDRQSQLQLGKISLLR